MLSKPAYFTYLQSRVLPLVFFHCHVIFTSSELGNYLSIMNNKYFSMKEQMLAAITEKKVQIWHSLLGDSIERHYTAQHIRQNAQLLSVNKIQHEFHHHFVPAEYQRGIGERDHILF